MPYNASIHAMQDPCYSINQHIHFLRTEPQVGSEDDRIRRAFSIAFWTSMRDDMMMAGDRPDAAGE
jgi:hypothetical protein